VLGVSEEGTWAANWLSGVVGSSLEYNASADFPDPPPPNPLFLGTFNGINYRDAATGVNYAPTSAADWNNNPPATVQQALDRIAAALGPIT
jgi:hypothetical protein